MRPGLGCQATDKAAEGAPAGAHFGLMGAESQRGFVLYRLSEGGLQHSMRQQHFSAVMPSHALKLCLLARHLIVITCICLRLHLAESACVQRPACTTLSTPRKVASDVLLNYRPEDYAPTIDNLACITPIHRPADHCVPVTLCAFHS
jgi:hypothetical protein